MDSTTTSMAEEIPSTHPVTTNPIEKTDEAHQNHTIKNTQGIKQVGWIMGEEALWPT
jgi:hypothetical protein